MTDMLDVTLLLTPPRTESKQVKLQSKADHLFPGLRLSGRRSEIEVICCCYNDQSEHGLLQPKWRRDGMLEFDGCVNLPPAAVQWPLNATSDRISAHVFDCSYQEPPPKFVFNAQAPRSLKNPVFTLELRGVGPNKEIVFLLPTSMGWDDRKRPLLARVVVFFYLSAISAERS